MARHGRVIDLRQQHGVLPWVVADGDRGFGSGHHSIVPLVTFYR
jgi:hypothetical protein